MTGRDTAEFAGALVLGALVGAVLTVLVRRRQTGLAGVREGLRRLGGGG